MKSNFKKVLDDNQVLLVDFFAEWCGPCKTMAPMLKEAKELVAGKAKIIKVDIDKNQELARSYRIQSVPTLVLFKNGEPVWRQSGVLTPPQIKSVVDQFG